MKRGGRRIKKEKTFFGNPGRGLWNLLMEKGRNLLVFGYIVVRYLRASFA